jgi:hypothetical protein
MKFSTGSPYNITHCAFLVTLQSGQEYVVDPTGIQFGPSWPLVCSYEHYQAHRMHPDHRKRNIRLRKLGRNWEVHTRGKPEEF